MDQKNKKRGNYWIKKAKRRKNYWIKLEISLKVINTPAPRSYSLHHSIFCFSVFGIICCYHGNTHSATVPKCVLHIYTSKRTCVPSLIWKCFFPSIVGIICRYHGNTFFPILKKVSCTSTPQGQHVNPISFELLVKCFVFQFLEYAVTMAMHIPPLSQNVSCTATLQREHVCQIWFEMHFPLKFWHNMPLPWQHFPPLSKSVFCTTTPYGHHVCQISL